MDEEHAWEDTKILRLMTEASCLERLDAFNGNLSALGGAPLDAFLLDDGSP